MYQDQPPPVNRYSKPVDNNYTSSPYPPNQPYYDNNPMPPFNNGPPPVDRHSRMLQPDPQFYQQPNIMPNHPPVGGPPPVNRASRVLSTPPPSQYMHGGADQYNAYQPPPHYPTQVPMHNGGSAYPPQPTPMPPMPAHQYNNHMPPPQYQSQPVMNQHMPPHPNIPPQTMPPTNNYSPPPQINVSPTNDINPQYVPVMLPMQQQPRPMSVPAPMTNEATQQHVPQIVVPGQQTNNMLAPNPAAPKRRNTVDPSAMPAVDNLNLSPRNFDQPSAPTKKPLPKIPLTKSNGPKGNPKAASAPTTPSIQSPVEEKPVQPTQTVPKQPAAMKVPPGNAKPKSALVMRVPKQPPPPMPPSDPSPPPRPVAPPTVPDKPEPVVVEDTPPPRPSTSPRVQVPVYEDPLPALPKSALPQNMTEGRDYKYYESGESLIVKKAMRGWKYREEARRKVKLGKNQIVLFVGDANCGKTAAIKAKLGSFPTEYKPSAFDMTKIKLDGNEIELWDIGDNPDMVSKLNLCFPVACCVVVVFALDNEESFRNVKLKWVPWAREKNPQAPILLLGTKLDLMTPEARSLHQPEHTERCQYAEKIDGCYVEGSAKTMEGFGEMFDIILTMLYSLAKKKPAKK